VNVDAEEGWDADGDSSFFTMTGEEGDQSSSDEAEGGGLGICACME